MSDDGDVRLRPSEPACDGVTEEVRAGSRRCTGTIRWGTGGWRGTRNWEPSSFTPAGPAWYEGATNRMVNAAVPVVQGGAREPDGDGRVWIGVRRGGPGGEGDAGAGATMQYWYDGEGRRVKKQERTETGEGTTTVTATVYVYDAGGEMVAEYGSGGGGSGLQYLVADHLGSTRLVVGAQMSCHDYTPFGEEIGAGVGGRNGCYGTGDGVTQKFTGKERGNLTTEGGLDYFGARYYSVGDGEVYQPGLVGKARASAVCGPLNDPQIAQPRYAYVRNNQPIEELR